VKELTAEEIFKAIDNKSVSHKAAFQLIESYANRKTWEAITELREKSGAEVGKEVEELVAEIIKRLDEFLEKVTGT
jgi:hypothetical protein